jgi:hypothetical protein
MIDAGSSLVDAATKGKYEIGNTVAGVESAIDITKTLSDDNLSFNQKVLKAQIQVAGGMLAVGLGSVDVVGTIAGAPLSGGTDVAEGVLFGVGSGIAISKAENWAFDKLGLSQ